MDFLNTTIGKVITIIISLYIVTSIIPKLLSARNDFAVVLGIVAILTLIVCAIKFYKQIINWLTI